MLQELKVIKWDKETWILATRYLAPVCIVANNWNQMKFVVLCQTNRRKPIHNVQSTFTLTCFVRFLILVKLFIKSIIKWVIAPYVLLDVPLWCIFMLANFKINLLILISLIVQTAGPASAKIVWNGMGMCVSGIKSQHLLLQFIY